MVLVSLSNITLKECRHTMILPSSSWLDKRLGANMFCSYLWCLCWRPAPQTMTNCSSYERGEKRLAPAHLAKSSKQPGPRRCAHLQLPLEITHPTVGRSTHCCKASRVRRCPKLLPERVLQAGTRQSGRYNLNPLHPVLNSEVETIFS